MGGPRSGTWYRWNTATTLNDRIHTSGMMISRIYGAIRAHAHTRGGVETMAAKLRELIDGRARALLRVGVCKSWRDARSRASVEMRCGAMTRKGTPCQAGPFGKGGRCRFHGGASTGPRTPEGKARSLAAAREGYARWRAQQKEAA